MATTHYHTPHDLHVADRVNAFVEGIKKALRQRAEYIRTFNELDRLSDRELNDLGIGRGSIAEIARNHVYGG